MLTQSIKSKLSVFYFFTFVSLCGLALFTSSSRLAATEEDSSPSLSTQEMPPTGFCQTKTDYDATVTCSDEIFMADNMMKLRIYQSHFGIANGKYKNLRIGFALSGNRPFPSLALWYIFCGRTNSQCHKLLFGW